MGRKKRRETLALLCQHAPQLLLFCFWGSELQGGDTWGQPAGRHLAPGGTATLPLLSPPTALRGAVPFLLFWSGTSAAPAPAARGHRLPCPNRDSNWEIQARAAAKPTRCSSDETPTPWERWHPRAPSAAGTRSRDNSALFVIIGFKIIRMPTCSSASMATQHNPHC